MAKKDKVIQETTEELEQEDKVLDEVELTKEEQLELQIQELTDTVKRLQNDYLREKADLENVKKRLSPDAASHVLCADISGLGITIEDTEHHGYGQAYLGDDRLNTTATGGTSAAGKSFSPFTSALKSP